jgi:hypothetical protein
MQGHHVDAPNQATRRIPKLGVRRNDRDGAEAEHEEQAIEDGDEPRRDQHRRASLTGIAHGEEAHQDVR